MTNTTDTTAGDIREHATRQAGWFSCGTGHLIEHYTTTGGDSALCNKGFTARYAPLAAGDGQWGYEISSDEEMAAAMAEFSHLGKCPKCVAKRAKLGL